MKFFCMFLCLVMVSQNLAKHPTDPAPLEKQDLSEEILQELKNASKTFGLYLENMKSMEDKINSLEKKMSSVENKIDSVSSTTTITGSKMTIALMNINSTDNKVTTRMNSVDKKINSLENKMSWVDYKIDSVQIKIDISEENVKSTGIKLNEIEDKMTSMENGIKSVEKKIDSVENKIDISEDNVKSTGIKLNEIDDKMAAIEDGITSVENKIDSVSSTTTTTEIKMSLALIDIKSTENKVTTCYIGKHCNCLDVMRCGNTKSGVFTIYLNNKPTKVYCDMETDGGGWLVFQRRADGSENFYRGWIDYKEGFGILTNEFWKGNEDLYQILNTCGNQHELRIDLEDFNNETRYAKYSTFTISGEKDNYRLTLVGYSGNAGDSLTGHNGYQFSTFDRDNDVWDHNCGERFKGGWWYNQCHHTNLNGLYLSGPFTGPHSIGVAWRFWRGYLYSLKFTEMKFRPK